MADIGCRASPVSPNSDSDANAEPVTKIIPVNREGIEDLTTLPLARECSRRESKDRRAAADSPTAGDGITADENEPRLARALSATANRQRA